MLLVRIFFLGMTEYLLFIPKCDFCQEKNLTEKNLTFKSFYGN